MRKAEMDVGRGATCDEGCMRTAQWREEPWMMASDTPRIERYKDN